MVRKHVECVPSQSDTVPTQRPQRAACDHDVFVPQLRALLHCNQFQTSMYWNKLDFQVEGLGKLKPRTRFFFPISRCSIEASSCTWFYSNSTLILIFWSSLLTDYGSLQGSSNNNLELVRASVMTTNPCGVLEYACALEGAEMHC